MNIPMILNKGKEPYYPVNDEKNNLIFKQYQELAQQQERVLFGGRLAQYTYADMDDTVAAALKLWKKRAYDSAFTYPHLREIAKASSADNARMYNG